MSQYPPTHRGPRMPPPWDEEPPRYISGPRFDRPDWFCEPPPELMAAPRPGATAGGKICGKRRVRSVIADLAIALCLLAAPAHAQLVTPDPKLTPGAIRTTSAAEVCTRGYDRAHRVWHDKRGTCAKYGLTPDQCKATEDDDLVPVCAGGDNVSPFNHWSQPLAEAQIKDRDEEQLCRLLCDRPSDKRLKAVQAYFRGLWWAK